MKKVVLFFLSVLLFSVGEVTAQNLLLNSDAETGDISGWVDVDDAWSADAVITPHAGNYFFWPARRDLASTELYQDVDLSTFQSLISAGSAWFELSGWLANWDQYPHDRATLALEAMDASGRQVLYLSADHRSPAWTQYLLEAPVPVSAVKCRVHLIATRFVGSDNDGYFDDLSLVVNGSAPAVYVAISSPENQVQIAVGNSLQLSAETVGAGPEEYIWSSSFDALGEVDSTGLVLAKQPGKFTILARGKESGKVGLIELTATRVDDIVFVAPESGAELSAASVVEVLWQEVGTIPSATLYFSTQNGLNWSSVATIDSISSGHYYWTVPDSAVAKNNCYLKLAWDGGEAVSSKFSIIPQATAVRDKPVTSIVTDFVLHNNYPNPFNPVTTISYTLNSMQNVLLEVFESNGKKITTLVNKTQPAGDYRVQFNAADLASGNYFVRLKSAAGTAVRQMQLIK